MRDSFGMVSLTVQFEDLSRLMDNFCAFSDHFDSIMMGAQDDSLVVVGRVKSKDGRQRAGSLFIQSTSGVPVTVDKVPELWQFSTESFFGLLAETARHLEPSGSVRFEFEKGVSGVSIWFEDSGLQAVIDG